MATTATLIEGEPGRLSTLLRAALPVVPGVNQLPGVSKAPAREFTGLAFRREHVVAERSREYADQPADEHPDPGQAEHLDPVEHRGPVR